MNNSIPHNTSTFLKGFSLVEILLAVALFSVVLVSLAGFYVYGQESSVLSGQRSRAVFLAEEGLEAARNIRDNDFDSLTEDTHGLAVSGGEWVLSGSSDTVDMFIRELTIVDIDDDRKEVSCTISWQQNAQRAGEVVLNTELTRWQGSALTAGSCNDYAIEQGYDAGTCRQSAAKCGQNSEDYLALGDTFCPGGSAKTCCGLP